MCGIVVVVRRPSLRALPSVDALEAELDRGARRVSSSGGRLPTWPRAAERVEAIDRELRGVPGLRALLAAPTSLTRLDGICGALDAEVATFERRLDEPGLSAESLEARERRRSIRLKDAVWCVRRDRLRNARAVGDLAGRDAGRAAIEAMASVQVALSSLDRLEVRGRDSAGLHLMVWDHGVDVAAPAMRALFEQRYDPLFGSGSVREHDGVLSFVYKAAAEIGELGDNTRVLREAITSDELLRLALSSSSTRRRPCSRTRDGRPSGSSGSRTRTR